MPGTHGERFELVDGHGNPPLSPRGLWQAQQVSARLVNHQIDALYASTLVRTQQTAAPLAAAKEMAVSIEHDLREVFLGIGEGGRFREMVHEEHPAIQQLRANRDWGEIPEAETNLELTERVIPVLETLHQTHLNQTIAIFCHGGVIGAAVAHVLNVNTYRMSGARNGSISEIVRTPNDWILRSFNDASHIGSLFQDHDPPADLPPRAESDSG